MSIILVTNSIGFLYRRALKPLLFLRDAESVHEGFTALGSLLGKFYFTRALTRALFSFQDKRLSQEIAGIKFRNPVGLSAGFDKDAYFVNILPAIGFGFGQVGTVTYREYGGNPKPRLVRVPESKAIVVNYGLKNEGAEKIIERLSRSKITKIPVSISIGKTNCQETVDVEKGIQDYVDCLSVFARKGLGDFYTINISCPNVFGGEPFTTAEKLSDLLERVKQLNINKPIFLKMPINLIWDDFKPLLDAAVAHNATGVIIGNLNKDPDILRKYINQEGRGGLSGKVCWDLSNDLISKTYQAYGQKLVIVGVGGVFSAADAYEKIKRGASLVQLITGMIYEGPQLIGQINRGLVKLLEKDGYNNIKQAIGASHR